MEDGGYAEGKPSTFNADFGLFEKPLAEYAQTTQSDKWDGLDKLHGTAAGDHFVKRIAKTATRTTPPSQDVPSFTSPSIRSRS